MAETTSIMQGSTVTSTDQVRKLEDGDDEIGNDGQDKKRQKGDKSVPIVSSHYNLEGSDITLISSDHVHFKVRSSILRRVS